MKMNDFVLSRRSILEHVIDLYNSLLLAIQLLNCIFLKFFEKYKSKIFQSSKY